MATTEVYENPYATQLFSDLTSEAVNNIAIIKKELHDVCENNKYHFLFERFEDSLKKVSADSATLYVWAETNNELGYLPSVEDCDNALTLSENCVRSMNDVLINYRSIAYHTKLVQRNSKASNCIDDLVVIHKKIEKNLRYLKTKLSPVNTEETVKP